MKVLAVRQTIHDIEAICINVYLNRLSLVRSAPVSRENEPISASMKLKNQQLQNRFKYGVIFLLI